MPPPLRPVPLPATHDHVATRLESDEEVLSALRASLTGAHVPSLIAAPPASPIASNAAHPPSTRQAAIDARPSSAAPFRPSMRPPVAVLTVFDDGKHEGEQFRLRGPRFVIGRTEGDLVIGHDNLISSRHVEITRQQAPGGWRWAVTDLKSTNGLFVRVLRTALADGSEILVGRGRYRFMAAPAVEPVPLEAARQSTQAWGDGEPQSAAASIVEMIESGLGQPTPLLGPEHWIGSDAGCSICRAGDPYCEARHVRLFRDSKGGWQAEHDKTINGLWFRISHVAAESTIQFQIGEQRFKLQVGG